MNIILILILIILFSIIGYLIYKVIKSENEKLIWIDTIQVGDTCRVVTVKNEIQMNNCKIDELKDDTVILKIEINKRWLYPPKNK